jgi:hypothetical protein
MYVTVVRATWLVSLLLFASVVTPMGGFISDAVRSRLALPARASESRLPNVDLFSLLLPIGAIPVWLNPSGEYPLPNEEVARYFDDAMAAQRAMVVAGRVEGAAAEYRLPSAPQASERAVLVVSTVAWYTTDAGAQSVIQDPTMALVIHRFGLHTAEITLPRIGAESRAFRGFRVGDDPERAAYLLVFRKGNITGTVVVVMSERNDDSGELAGLLAHKQHNLLP